MGKQEVIDQQAELVSQGQKQALVDGLGACYDAGFTDGGGQPDTTPFSQADIDAAIQPLKDANDELVKRVDALIKEDEASEKVIADLKKSLADFKAAIANIESFIPNVLQNPPGGGGSEGSGSSDGSGGSSPP